MSLLGVDITKLNHVVSCIDSSTNEVLNSKMILKVFALF